MTTFVIEGRRKSVVLFAVVAMIAALFAIPVAPAHGVATAACPATIPSAGFTDLGGFSADVVDAANCLAHYDITKGTSATTYGPSANVSRWQMALFLTRQAEDHGVSLPSGADQGFTDLTGLSAEAVTAINQLAQLNITKGTTATTFDPNGNVSRWQMALFITRLVSAAGIALPSGADQGFTDLAGLSAEAVTAINQLAQLNVSLGTSATTFGPSGLVTRAQMALFLTRTLEAGGVTPPPIVTTGQVVVTPSTQTSIGNGAARGYSATFKNADGSLYSGFVGIDLVDANTANAPVYNTPAVGVTFESVDGAAVGGTHFGGFAGSDGVVSFVIRHAGAASDAVPVAWIDVNGDGDYETTGNNAPTEPFGLGGETDFSGAPAVESTGVGSPYVDFVVGASVDTTGDDFEASLAGVSCGNGAGALCQFDYDSNDVFIVEGVVQTLAGFEAALSETDVITITYDPDVADVSTFEITTDNTASSTLKVTDPSAAKSIDSANYSIVGTGEVGAAIRIYTDLDADHTTTAGETVLGSGTVNAGGVWSITVPLTQDADNNFAARQVVGTDPATYADVPTITEGAPAAAKITSAVFGAVLPAGLSANDTLVITFNETIEGVGTGDTVAIQDTDGTTATFVSGAADTTFSLDATKKILTLTVVNPPFPSGGTTAGILGLSQITAVTGFQGTDGLDINVAGSGGGRNFTVS